MRAPRYSKTKIPRKATTQIVIGTLDEIIENTVAPLLKDCDLYRRLLLQLLFDYSSDSRRRFGVDCFWDCGGYVLKAIATKNYQYLREAKVDRSILMCLAKICLDQFKGCLKIEQKVTNRVRGWLTKQHMLGLKVGCKPYLLAPLYRWCHGYAKLHDQYLKELINKYERLIESRASQITYSSKMYVDNEQLKSNLTMAVGRGIDRCNVEMGTLTNLILKSFMTFTNNPDFEHLFNVAFTVPGNVRRRRLKTGEKIENFSVDLEKAEGIEDDKDITKQMDLKLVAGLQKLRGSSIACLVLKLPIILSEKEKALLLGRAP